MTRVSKRNFGESLSHAMEASDVRDQNLKTIFGIIDDVKADIEHFTDDKVSFNYRDSQMHAYIKAASFYTSYDKTKPIHNNPTNQVLFFLSTVDNSKKEDLTILELGSEGFPCTIYVDGNRMTAADAESFEDNLDILLSSPSTGEKLKSLINIEVEPEVSFSTHPTISYSVELKALGSLLKEPTPLKSG